MSDLRCRRCGATASYADAQIADLNRTCEDTREFRAQDGTMRESTFAAEHDWTEAGV